MQAQACQTLWLGQRDLGSWKVHQGGNSESVYGDGRRVCSYDGASIPGLSSGRYIDQTILLSRTNARYSTKGLNQKKWIIGVDEVGRGPLAGPLYVCACAMPFYKYRKMRWHRPWGTLTDSKLLKPPARFSWYQEALVMEKTGRIKIGMGIASAAQIDRLGLSVCIRTSVEKAITKLGIDPVECSVLLDGSLKAPSVFVKQKTIIKGDQKKKIISLASVIAKVVRDDYMTKQGRTYPDYRWEGNKGYGTRMHCKAIAQFGLTPLHRKSSLTRLLDKTI